MQEYEPARRFPEATTHRQKLIARVRQYNMTQPPRRRFYMTGLSSEELQFLNGHGDEAIETLGTATDGCPRDKVVSSQEVAAEEAFISRKIAAVLAREAARVEAHAMV